jgi:hypothetical protein
MITPGQARRLVKLGGALALAAALALALVVVVRDVGLNVLNLTTVLGAILAGLLLSALPPRTWTLVVAEVPLLVAALPAMIGGLGLLLVPSIVLVCAALLLRPWARKEP